MLANKAISRVHDFTYLESNISEDGGTRRMWKPESRRPEELLLD
jgi:hypothetical protein